MTKGMKPGERAPHSASASSMLLHYLLALGVFFCSLLGPVGGRAFADTNSYMHVMLDYNLKIPQGFLFRFPTPRERINADSGLHLHMVLPNLDPKTDENKAEFSKRGWGNLVSALLIPKRNFRLGDESLRRYQSHIISPLPVEGNGVAGYRLTYALGTDLYIFSKDLFLTCARPSDVPYPSCTRNIEIYPGVRLEYTFSKQFLHQAPMVETKIVMLFRGFLVRGD